MNLLPRRRVGWAMLAALMGALAVGGIAWATIPDSSGVIDGCYTKSSGSLRVIDTSAGQSCDTKRESPLRWNETGPQGPAGAPGETGPAGPRGPSDAWDAQSGYNNRIHIGAYETAVTVVSLSLPPGDFLVLAKTSIAGIGGITCYLREGYETLDTSTGGASALTTIPVQSTVHLPSGGAVYMACTTNGVSGVMAFDAHINAIEVGALH